MKTVTISRGLPASGKTTWAETMLGNNPGMFKRINKDDIRAMLDNSKWSKDNEKFVLRVRDELILMALNEGKHVIIDDTNGHHKHVENIKKLVKGMNVQVNIKEFNVDIEECIERDLKRQNSVGEKVIRNMYNQFFKPERKIYNPDLLYPEAIICDIDGTLAQTSDRSPYDWKRVGEDSVNVPIAQILKTARQDIILLSGRDSICRDETIAWLEKHNINYDKLYMRPEGDNRKDVIIKKELFDNHVRDKFNVSFVLDDRLQVCQLWHSMGLTLLRVGDPDANF